MSNRSDLDVDDWRRLCGVALLSGVLFVLPAILPVEVQVVVENVGDVSKLLAGVWSLVTGVATLVSFVLATLSYHGGRDGDRHNSDGSGPDTSIHIEGVEGDLKLVLGEQDEIGGYERSSGAEVRETSSQEDG